MDEHGLQAAGAGRIGPAGRTDGLARHPLRADLLDALPRIEAPHGCLSVYAATDPADPDRARIEFKNACAELEGRTGANGSATRLAGALEAARDGARDALRGGGPVAGFIPLGDPLDGAIWVDLPEVVPAALVSAASPYALPLLSMIERFGPGGVVTLARDRIALYHWEHGALEKLEREVVDVDTATWRDTQGPFNAAAGRSGGVISTVGSNDAYEHKREDAMLAELARVAAPLIEERSRERRWERLIWFGEPAIVDAVRASLRGAGPVPVIADGSQLLGRSTAALLERVRRTSDERWTHDTLQRARALAERGPAERVESIEEAGALAGEGRVDELYVTVDGGVVDDEPHRRVNALLVEVVRHGGRVRALRRAGGEVPAVVATLRW